MSIPLAREVVCAAAAGTGCMSDEVGALRGGRCRRLGVRSAQDSTTVSDIISLPACLPTGGVKIALRVVRLHHGSIIACDAVLL